MSARRVPFVVRGALHPFWHEADDIGKVLPQAWFPARELHVPDLECIRNAEDLGDLAGRKGVPWALLALGMAVDAGEVALRGSGSPAGC